MAWRQAFSWWTLCLLGALQYNHERSRASSNDGENVGASLVGSLFGLRGEMAVICMMLGLCFWTCVAYVDFIADIIGPVVSVFFRSAMGSALVPGRTFLVTSLVWILIFPLASLRDLAALAPFSALGVATSGYVAFFVLRRSLDGAYNPGGLYAEAHNERPREVNSIDNASTDSMSTLAFKCVNFAVTAAVGFLSHYNAGDYFKSLSDATPRRFAVVSGCAFLIATAVYTIVMVSATHTFDSDKLLANPSLLSCYNGKGDNAADIGRLGLSLALITSFPLMFAGLRRSMMAVFDPLMFEEFSLLSAVAGRPLSELPATDEQRSTRRHTNSTLFLLACVHVAALVVPDVGLLVSVLGSVFGSCVMFALPGALAIAHVNNQTVEVTTAAGMDEMSPALTPLEVPGLPSVVSNFSNSRALRTYIERFCVNVVALSNFDAILPNLDVTRSEKGKVEGASRTVYWLLIAVAVVLAVAGFPYGGFSAET